MSVATDSATGTIPDYSLIAPIGRGAYGTVYLAEDLVGVRRAVKVLPKRVLDTRVDPVKELAGIRAYQQTARGHPALIQILHVGETPECYYYVMELADPLDGPPGAPHTACAGADHPPTAPAADAYRPLTLKCLIEREAPLPPARALEILADLLRGLAHLHSRGLIHRDVKPSNILFVDGRPRLGDLGLVTSTDRDVTQLGTPGYMPPDTRIDATADLYAAGVVLYEMVTGLHRERFPELPGHRYTSRRELRDFHTARLVFNRAAHPDRRQRYQSAEAMLRDLKRPAWAIKASRSALGVCAGLGLLTLLGVAAWIYWRPDGRIESAELADPGRDEKGIRLRYGDGAIRVWKQDLTLTGPVVLADLEGSGRPLVYFGLDWGGKLLAIDPRAYRLSGDGSFRAEEDACNPPPPSWASHVLVGGCKVVPRSADDLDGDGHTELIVTAEHYGGACELIVFTRGGKRLGQYWHFGWPAGWPANAHDLSPDYRALTTVDLDGDGTREIVFAGIANRKDRGDPVPREIYHVCVFVVDIGQIAKGDGFWSMNPWMNEGSPSPPRAYGYVNRRYNDETAEWTLSRFVRTASGFTLWFRNDLTLHLDKDLEPLKPYLGTREAVGGIPAKDVWTRMDTSQPPGRAKDIPPGAKDPPPGGQ